MMHYSDTVVTIVDGNNKPIRELEAERTDKGRKCKIFLPFESEYKFLIKNNSDTRIKLEIEIDGTNVTNDGLVVFAYNNYFLERFLNSPEKFKFVRRNDDRVSDPSNIDNGTIKVKVYKEIKPYTPPNQPVYPSVYSALFNQGQISRGDYGDYGNETYVEFRDYCAEESNFKMSKSAPSFNCSLNNSSIRSFAPQQKTLGEAGATVGGSRSNQQFTSTIRNGDPGVDSVFIFNLRGIDDSRNKKLQEYLKLKEELGM